MTQFGAQVGRGGEAGRSGPPWRSLVRPRRAARPAPAHSGSEGTPWIVQEASEGDLWEADLLQVLAFGQPTEAAVVRALRGRGLIRAEVIARQDGAIIGHLPVSDLIAPEGWVTFLPMAVRCDAEAAAVKGAMVREAKRYLAERGTRMIVTTGDPEFYRANGFRYRHVPRLDTPFPVFLTGLSPVSALEAMPAEPTRLVYPDEILTA